VILTIAQAKGGTGKTTCAVALAEVAARETGKPVLLVDSDPQASSLSWAGEAEERGRALACATVGLPSSQLRNRLSGVGADRYELVVIDTPPGAGGIVTSALEVADITLLPTRPTVVDLRRLWPTLDLAAKAGTRSLVVLTMARAGTRSLEAARDAVKEGGATVAATVVPMREAIAQAFGTVPSGILADVAHALLLETFKTVEKRK
jgi:chromosome partitioning protein